MYIRSKYETFNELEPKLDRGDGISGDGESNVGNMVIGFLLTGDYSEEQALKGISNDL